VVRLKKSDGDVGVVLCDCNGELKHRLDFPSLEKKLNTLSAVIAVKRCSRLCDPKECSDAVTALLKNGASRLAVGGCGDDLLETALEEAVKKNGLNNSLLWPVNIREHCGLVHKNKKAATKKAYRRLSAIVNRVRLAEPSKTIRCAISRDVAVVGGGFAGKQAAVALADLGHRVALVYKDAEQSGVTAITPEFYGYLGDDPDGVADSIETFNEELNQLIKKHKIIDDYSESYIHSIEGDLGNFTINLSGNGKAQKIQAGAVILTSCQNVKPVVKTLKIGKLPGVVDMHRLLKLIRSGDVPGNVAILTGYTGEQGRAVSAQVWSAAELLVKRFGVQVKVYCRNVQVAATGLERLYRRSRSEGVIIVKSENKPVISTQGSKLSVKSKDPVAAAEITDVFDLVVIADIQYEGNGDGAVDFMKELRYGPDGALQYDNIWLLPTHTNRPGIFVIGDARGNSEYREALTDGLSAASSIHSLLAGDQMEVSDDAAAVDSNKCVLCLTCLRLCPHGAIHIDDEEHAACVSPLSCQRCGICVAECPAKAIKLPGYSDEEIKADIGEKPHVTVFTCENSAVPAAEAAGLSGFEYEAKVELIRVPCAGRVDPHTVLTALEAGAEKVFVLGCHPESCQYLTGASRSSRRIDRLTAMLDNAGFDGSRVFFGGLSAVEPGKFIEYVTG